MDITVKYPKRLIEVDLPIKTISTHARQEKDMRRGHVPLLYIWPATRPTAACRAIICASLWPDPFDDNCPKFFREKAIEIITDFAKKAAIELANYCSNEAWKKWQILANSKRKLDANSPEDLCYLRGLLLDFIADFSTWSNSTQKDYIETSRRLTQVAHEALGGIPGTKPIIADSFAGGGAIPLESLRVGASAFASDLNSVAVLFNKFILEYIPKHGTTIINEIRNWESWAKQQAKEELADFYPNHPDGAIPIAYLWARTIISEAPGSGDFPIEVPLIRSMWLAKKGKRQALRWVKDEKGIVQTEILEVAYNDGTVRKVRRPILEIFEPKKDTDVTLGTVRRGSATCPVTNYTTPAKRVQAQLQSRQGGAKDARLFCVVLVQPNEKGRLYRLPIESDFEGEIQANKKLTIQEQNNTSLMSLIPNELTPIGGGRGAGRAFSQRKYGINKWGDIFTSRQALALTTYIRLAQEYIKKLINEGNESTDAISCCLGLIVARLTDLNASLCGWQLSTPNTAHVFVRWALQIVMDFGEVNLLAGAGGSPESVIKRVVDGIKYIVNSNLECGDVVQSSASSHPLPDNFIQAFITDPPYFDAVPYADLSDYFYVWLKRVIIGSCKSLFNLELTDKDEECIVDEIKGKDRDYFVQTMTKSLKEGRRILQPHGIGVVVFAHKTTSGWESLLQAMIEAGWIVTASWPIDTEMSSRLRAKDSAALASSVHIVCRPRTSDSIGDWRDVLQELPQRIHEWMPRLASEGVVGADAIFACLGPALEIFSRYSSVEKASGELVTLKEYLEYVWAAVSKEALSMIFSNADTTSFEEDARLTAMWLWTLSTGSIDNNDTSESEPDDEDDETSSKTSKTGGYTLEFDAARKIAQGLGAHLEQLTRLVEVKGSTARLLPVSERTQYLFGKEEAQTPSKTKGKKGKKKEVEQLNLFAVLGIPETEEDTDWGEKTVPQLGNTTLDRIHQSMILFAAGRSEALKRFLVDEGAGNDQRFWGLAQALSALYPTGTDEKRWVDGVLARKKGLGF